jgi:hypothetical protein
VQVAAWLVLLQVKNKHERSSPVRSTGLTGVRRRSPETSKRRTCVGIAWLASRLSRVRSPGIRPMEKIWRLPKPPLRYFPSYFVRISIGVAWELHGEILWEGWIIGRQARPCMNLLGMYRWFCVVPQGFVVLFRVVLGGDFRGPLLVVFLGVFSGPCSWGFDGGNSSKPFEEPSWEVPWSVCDEWLTGWFETLCL